MLTFYRGCVWLVWQTGGFGGLVRWFWVGLDEKDRVELVFEGRVRKLKRDDDAW